MLSTYCVPHLSLYITGPDSVFAHILVGWKGKSINKYLPSGIEGDWRDLGTGKGAHGLGSCPQETFTEVTNKTAHR